MKDNLWKKFKELIDKIEDYSNLTNIWASSTDPKPTRKIPNIKVKKAWFERNGLHVIEKVSLFKTRHILFKDCHLKDIRW